MEHPVLTRAYKAWMRRADLRARRERYKRFTYGDQWSDPVEVGNGYMVEREAIRRDGKRPYTNNLIRQLVKTVVGHYRSRATEAGRYGGAVEKVAQTNSLAELDARLMEEFLISGCAIQRTVSERRWGGAGVWVDNVDPRRFFVNTFQDPRGWDIELVGMLHDMSLPELLNRFGGSDRRKSERIRRIYSTMPDHSFSGTSVIGTAGEIADFFRADSDEKCRVIEVWSFDAKARRASGPLDFTWRCRMFAPDGSVLAEYDSPLGHRGHPFSVKFYPLTDGEVHSFVEDVLDQQKFINRLIVMMDHIMACSAKGVLLFPIEQLPKGQTWNDVARTWAEADGIIPITGRGGVMPQQVTAGNGNAGAYQLLELQMRLLEEVSGVSSALMGRGTVSARGAEMLDSQIRSATLALTDLFETFDSFTLERNNKILQTK